MSNVSIFDWFKRIAGKQSGEKQKRRVSVLAHNHGTKAVALEAVKAEQRDLSHNLGKMIDRTERALNDIAVELKADKPHDKQSLAQIHQRQARIRLAITRLETALQRTQDLERELTEWNLPRLKHEQRDRMRADVKNEIIKSELAVRELLQGRKARVEKPVIDKSDGFALTEPKIVTFDVPMKIADGKITRTASSLRISRLDANHLEPSSENIVRSIRELSNELSKHEQVPKKDVKELASLAHQIRDLHAILRRVDKKFGKMRDRIAMTDGFRHVFQHH